MKSSHLVDFVAVVADESNLKNESNLIKKHSEIQMLLVLIKLLI